MRAFPLIVTLGVIFSLVYEVRCVLPEVVHHPHIDYILDAKFLWNTVTNMKVLPGWSHTLNEELGMTQRWKDFLRDHGQRELAKAIE